MAWYLRLPPSYFDTMFDAVVVGKRSGCCRYLATVAGGATRSRPVWSLLRLFETSRPCRRQHPPFALSTSTALRGGAGVVAPPLSVAQHVESSLRFAPLPALCTPGKYAHRRWTLHSRDPCVDDPMRPTVGRMKSLRQTRTITNPNQGQL